MHDVTVTFDGEAVRHLHRAALRDTTNVVAAEVEQHEVLGPLFRVGQQRCLRLAVRCRCRAARARPCDGADRDLLVTHADEDFGARSDDGKAGKVEEIEERRWVHPTQSAVESDRRQLERGREALRKHDLEDIARGNVLLRRIHHAGKLLGRHGGLRVA